MANIKTSLDVYRVCPLRTRVEDVVVAQVQDLNVVVELEQVAELSRVLQAVELVVGQVQLP